MPIYTRDIVPTRRCKRVLQAVHISRGVKATEVYIAHSYTFNIPAWLLVWPLVLSLRT